MDLNEQTLLLFKNMINDIVDILPEGETQLVILEKYSDILKLEELIKTIFPRLVLLTFLFKTRLLIVIPSFL